MDGENARQSLGEPPRIVLRRSETQLVPQADEVLTPFTATDWRNFTILMAVKPASGRVMTLQAARQAKMRTAWMVGGLLAAGTLLVVLFAGPPQALPVVLGVGGLIWMACGAIGWLWLASVASQFRSRLIGHAKPGVVISVDDEGLSLDARTFAWSDLALAEVVLRPDGDDFILLRLSLAGALAGVDLDVDLIENGRSIVEHVCVRLYPQPMG